METKILEKIGFTNGEIRVYFALLECGNTTTGPVIIKSGVSRSKVYEILEKLKQKGLVSEVIKENTRYFQAASPERIIDYIKSKEKEIIYEQEQFTKILPGLLAKQKYSGERQEAKVYVGYEGVKTFYNEVLDQLQKGDEYLAMTFSKETWQNKSLSLFFLKFHQKRAEKKVKAKVLYNFGSQSFSQKTDFLKTGFYEIRKTDVILPTGIAIVKDTVATLLWSKNPKLFAIVSKENAYAYRTFFYDIWRKAKKK
ncbi:MAG: helix-turn-helix domain-containing protein [Nanoarchaeota archaeon]